MNRDQEIGQHIINSIVEGSLFEVKEGGALIVWRQNADEQIGQAAMTAIAQGDHSLFQILKRFGWDESKGSVETWLEQIMLLNRQATSHFRRCKDQN